MLGTIEVHRPGHEPIRPRGARLRTVLGLMVANAMLQKRLGYREFCQLAAGGEDDPERARKMTSMAVLRLRESVGDDFLRANAETPELDLDRVGVDLLDADRLLRQSLRDARAGDLKRALPLLLEAFALIGAEVPFPKLYDDFFEALRADFDFNLRETAIEVGSGLLHEGDPAGAEEVLHRAYDAMPEDEEIADLLCQSLERQGKRVDAERVRKRVDR
jgi:DNA-binding SARP family transcriptional activator